MMKRLQAIVNKKYTLNDEAFLQECKKSLDDNGIVVLPDFINNTVLEEIAQEGKKKQHLAFYTTSKHNIYLVPSDDNFSEDHIRNRLISTEKGCITDDLISADSPLKVLYNNELFKSFLCYVLGEKQLYPYVDPLSSVNIHYASDGQGLGWHFDNSSFAITLLIAKPKGGGEFEYVRDIRDADAGEMGFELAEKIVDGKIPATSISPEAGTLVLFRGRNSIHRVIPTVGDKTRMLSVLAYNNAPNVALSESARMTFYGRLG
ncbi:2OG-Fe(II) oxygenase [Phocoenobacter atlanticus]|uniref:2OG-Fe(II) oxygenase n=1 Tax=Phocoenobacter atlanticus TaxID=3416742 RepID=UPI0027489837|nr:2OG-Fe(II) oxygenase [Pasteurella atlantica]MDP8100844.1 2OG-Fe(II) oxygenase [Pasteurella atlantica]